jgi:subtilase family serine protease
MRLWKVLLPLLASTLAFAAQPDRILSTIDSSQGVALARSLHPKARAEFDQGLVEPSLKLSYMTLLMAPSPSQQKALDLLLAQQQDRTSPNYHKWLTPQQFADRFGLSQNDLSKVTGWLKGQGFQILSTGGGRNTVVFSGTAGQVQSAFGTEIHRYSVNGELHIANASAIKIPAALNGVVRTVMGVHNFGPHPATRFRGPGASHGPRPNYFDAHFDTNFMSPGDIATVYDLNPLYNASTPIDGTGQKLGIIGQTDVYLADINDFRSGFNLSQITGCTTNANGVITACNSTNFQYVAIGTDPGTTYGCGDLGEADLDIEWSGAVARNAQIVFVNAPVVYDANCNPLSGGGVNAALTAAVDPSSGPVLAPVVSLSYGACELEAEDLESVLLQGNVEGVTIMNSSGDVGSATCDFNPPNSSVPFQPAVNGLAVSYPASSPEVTAVGGTEISLADDASPPNSFWGTTNGTTGGSALIYIPEVPWNDDEELAQACQGEPSNIFCVQGGSPKVAGWVPLTASATAAQVQEDIWLSIGGGGASNCFYETSGGICLGAGAGPNTGGGVAQPTYQQGLVVSGAPAGVRWVPDVSLLASPNFPGYIFCTPPNAPSDTTSTCASGIANAIDNNESLVGGTSASSPIFAGIVTLLNQYLVVNGFQSTAGLGNANTNLYHIARYNASAFHPIKSGNNTVYCQAGTPASQPTNIQCPAGGSIGYSGSNSDAATGYNLVTGLGSVDGNALAVAWGDLLTPSTITVSPSQAQIVIGQSESFTATVAPSGASGVVSFFNNGSTTALGTAQVSAGTATFTTTSLPSGTDSITATYNGIFATSSSSATSVTVTVPTFSLTPAATTLSIAPGATSGNTVNLTVASSDGFIVNNNGTQVTVVPVQYSCTISPAPAGASCKVIPNMQTSVINPTVTVATMAPTVQLRPPFNRGSGVFYAMLLPGLFGIVFAAGAGKRGARLLGLIVLLGVSTMWLGSCGGSGSSSSTMNPGTPAGTYTVNVVGTTSTTPAITANTSIMLTVQ